MTSAAVALSACGSATEEGRPMNAADTSRAATTHAAATPVRSASNTVAPAATPARAAGNTVARAATAQPSHLTRKIKSGHRVVLPSHLILPPPAVHQLVTRLMPLRTHPMTSSEHLPPMPSPARLERPVG
jgi:hypothetical protein